MVSPQEKTVKSHEQEPVAHQIRRLRQKRNSLITPVESERRSGLKGITQMAIYQRSCSSMRSSLRHRKQVYSLHAAGQTSSPSAVARCDNFSIIAHYQSEYRGFVQYYLLAQSCDLCKSTHRIEVHHLH